MPAALNKWISDASSNFELSFFFKGIYIYINILESQTRFLKQDERIAIWHPSSMHILGRWNAVAPPEMQLRKKSKWVQLLWADGDL